MSLNPIIRLLGQKRCPVARGQSDRLKISKNKKMFFFSYPTDHSTHKLGSYAKKCALQSANGHTDRQTRK